MKRLRLLGGTVLVISMFWLLGAVVSSPSASAATLNVVAGTDAIDENGQCQLSEAIQNINDQSTTNVDCDAGDEDNDTINLPSGTITLSADLPFLIRSLTIQGQGMGDSIISGNEGQYQIFYYNELTNADTITIEDLGMTEYRFEAVAIYNANVDLFAVDIDGASIASKGIFLMNQLSGTNSVLVSDVKIHNLNNTSVEVAPIGGNGNGITNIIINNFAIYDIHAEELINTLLISAGYYGGHNNHTVNAEISNVTINNVVSTGGSVTMLTTFAFALDGTSTVNLNANNVTAVGLRGGTSVYGDSAALGTTGAAIGPSDNAIVNAHFSNILVSDNIHTGYSTSVNCMITDMTSIFSGSGNHTPTITSSGGNISDDSSCTNYFTDPTDLNNVDPADLHLGTLGDHGGSVPTIPLLVGSIAIDSGVDVIGLTTDARGITRPQCASYDSGAYEYNGTCPTTSSTSLTYPDPITNSTVSLVLPSDVTNGTVSAISPTTIPKDTFFFFPLGLTSFQFSTTVGATKTITLYYDLPGDSSLYTARKYNTNTKTFSTITNATITRVTYNNKSQIKLTYDITDGGTLDQDNQANGTIIDPVGLAAAKVGVPNTGLR